MQAKICFIAFRETGIKGLSDNIQPLKQQGFIEIYQVDDRNFIQKLFQLWKI